MNEKRTLQAFLLDGPVVLVGLFAVALATIEILVDWNTWIELNVSIVYSLPLVVASASHSRRLLWSLASLLIGVTFAIYFGQIPPGHFFPQESHFVDRCLASVTIFLTASLLHQLMLARDVLEEQDRCLNEQNEDLAVANEELALSREAVAQQNKELRDRRRDAEEASVRKTRMLASLSHDIRTPLQAITMMAEVMHISATRPEMAAQVPLLAQRLRANALATVEMLSEVIDSSTFESGRITLNKREFLLNELLAEECSLLLPLAQAKNLQLVVKPMNMSLELSTDRTKLARILGNLVGNAIKFTHAGVVTMAVHLTSRNDVLISVRDTGRGIDPHNLKQIFEEFSQVPESQRNTEAGWGLGLSICRRLANLMGGDITAESRLGEGSLFTVRLPRACIVDAETSPREGYA